MSTYDGDYYAWTQEQATLLRELKPEWLDWAHLAEEVEDLGRSERRALESHLENLLIHLLKWRYQPAKRSSSWEVSILNPRGRIGLLLGDNPSLNQKSAVLSFSVPSYCNLR